MSTALRRLLLCALFALLIVPFSQARAQDNDVDIGYFYEQLEPYGRWIDHPRWGEVWSPDVDPDWRPYTMGYWTYTEDNGWYWVSDEPFGWAVFHYGRWVLEGDEWLWIPGTEWAPAWVSWRADDGDEGYVGWAPLPPGSEWGPDGSLMYDDRYYDNPRFGSIWVFVRPSYMTVPGMYRYAAPRTQNIIILRRARFLHSYRRSDRRVFNGGLELRRFERLTGRPVVRMRIEPFTGPRDRDFRDRRNGNNLQVFRPNIIAPRDGVKPRPNFKAERTPAEKALNARRAPDNKDIRRDGPSDIGRGTGRDVPDVGRGTGRDGPADAGRGKGTERKDVGEPKGGQKQFAPEVIGKEPVYKGPQKTERAKELPERRDAPKGASPSYKPGSDTPTNRTQGQGRGQDQGQGKGAGQVQGQGQDVRPPRTVQPERQNERTNKAPEKRDDKKGVPGEPK